MISISHWGMFDARNIPYRYWPLRFGNGVDTQFEAARAEYERCRLGTRETCAASWPNDQPLTSLSICDSIAQ